MEIKTQTVYRLIFAFFLGAVGLCSLSFLQKLIAGYNPFIVKGYIIPFFFGGFTGSIIGVYIFKVKDLNNQLAKRVNNLEQILPICSYCKKIRKANSEPQQQDSWEKIEFYISHKTTSTFSHGMCPECMENHHTMYVKNRNNNFNNS